jgi:hypothetical protein
MVTGSLVCFQRWFDVIIVSCFRLVTAMVWFCCFHTLLCPHEIRSIFNGLYIFCNWFFMTPSIATKFQYINFSSYLTRNIVLSLTEYLWRRQSQQSFNTWTPFNFLFYSLHVSDPTGHPQVRYTISYFCFNCISHLRMARRVRNMYWVEKEIKGS